MDPRLVGNTVLLGDKGKTVQSCFFSVNTGVCSYERSCNLTNRREDPMERRKQNLLFRNDDKLILKKDHLIDSLLVHFFFNRIKQ